jgi:hypothetical protein
MIYTINAIVILLLFLSTLYYRVKFAIASTALRHLIENKINIQLRAIKKAHSSEEE